MSEPASLLAHLRGLGISVRISSDNLALRPFSAVPEDLKASLKAAKPELLALLRLEETADRALRNLDAANGADVDGSGGRVKQLQPQRADGGGAIEPSSPADDRGELHRRRALARDIRAGIAASAASDFIDPASFNNFDPVDVAARTASQLDAQAAVNQARWDAAPTEPLPPPPPPDFDSLVARLAAALATPRPYQRISGDPDRALAYFRNSARRLLSTARGHEDQLIIVVREEQLAAKCTTTNQRNKGSASDA
jgi:hypothetical protein